MDNVSTISRVSTVEVSPTAKKELDDKPKPNDFDNFVPWACREFSIPVDVIITRSLQKVALAGPSKQKQKTKRPSLVLMPSAPDSTDYMDNVLSSSHMDEVDIGERVAIETFYDTNENLVQLKFSNNKEIPRKVIQVIGLTIPYQRHLTSIKIDSGLFMESLYEISKILKVSQITELCLDGTFLSEANYHSVLTANKLKHLSISKCKLNDAVVKLIAEQLIDPSPASKVLSALNLSNNRITDDGAKHIARMLRINRQLRYLNVSGNMITDEGGVRIMEVLQKFPLHALEVAESRAKYVLYLRQKKVLTDKYILELHDKHKHLFDKIAQKKKMATKNSDLEKTMFTVDTQILRERAEYMAENIMGKFSESFSLSNTETVNGVVHCLGNNGLCYLNLAYNNLTYISLKKIHEVLLTQKTLNRTPKGLIKIIFEGNPMPIACNEYDDINALLGSVFSKGQDNLKRKSFVQTRTSTK